MQRHKRTNDEDTSRDTLGHRGPRSGGALPSQERVRSRGWVMPREEAFSDPARKWVALLWFGLFALFAGFLWYALHQYDVSAPFDDDDDDDGLGLLPHRANPTA